MSTTNYDGRKLDFCILGTLPYAAGELAEVNTTLDLVLGGRVCAGVVKLMQKVLVLFMTYTYRYDPSWGTVIPEVITTGNLNTVVTQLEQSMPKAMEKVANTLRTQEYADTPLDERVAKIEQDGETVVDYNTLTISVSLRVTTLAGFSNSIIVPIRTKV